MDLFEHAENQNVEAIPAEVSPEATVPAMPRRFGFGLSGAGLKFKPTVTANPRPVAAPFLLESTVEIQGKVRRVVCPRVAESGFTVLAVRLPGGDETSVQGYTSQTFREGDPVVAEGNWATYKGKRQFKAEIVRLLMPRGTKGVADWLAGGAVKGVGRGMVAKLVARHPDDLPEIMGDTDALVAAGIKLHLAEAISHTWNANGGTGELEGTLRGMGLKPRQIFKVIQQFGAAAKKIVETNPWRLVEIEGIGFPTADAIALGNDLDMTCSSRVRTGLAWALSECLNREGHCGFPEPRLVAAASDMLDLDQEIIEASMEAFVDGTRVIRDDLTGLLYPVQLLEAEETACDHLAALLARSRGALQRDEAEDAVLRAERELGVELDRDGGQFEAAVSSLCNAVMVITGGPGTGKSTTQAVIVKAHTYFGREAARVQLSAPTGRAARRLSDTSGRDARTIHRMLAFNPIEGGFSFNAENPLKLDVAIVDEFSMVDTRLFASLVEALPPDACLCLVGDADQLPSVGPGQVLRDLIDSGQIPVVRLTRVHRQAAGSGVAIAAQRINKGLAPEEVGARIRGFAVYHKSDHALVAEIVRLVRFGLPERGFDPMRDVQVLAAMKKGDVGVDVLNDALKAALNPALEDGRSVKMPNRMLTMGDRIMQLRNDYKKGVYNGEVGVVTSVGVEQDGKMQRPWVTVDFSGIEARYTPDDADDLTLAYAATVHKIQGCEAPIVLFAVPYAHRRMLNRNLLYTGVTRARIECLVIGDKATINEAPQRADAGRRYTGLRERLKAAMLYETPGPVAPGPSR